MQNVNLQLHHYKCVNTNIFKYMTYIQVSTDIALKFIAVYNAFNNAK